MTEQTVVREMLTQEYTWVLSTWNAGAAAGMRWNGNIRQWEHIGKKRKKEEDNPEEEEEGDVDLTAEVKKQFNLVMNTFNEARRTGEPLRYDREVTQGICGFNKARGRCRAL